MSVTLSEPTRPPAHFGPVELILPYPVSSNRYWKTRVIQRRGALPMALTYVSAEAKAYRTEVAWLAKAAGIRAPYRGRVALDLKLYPQRPLDWAKRAAKDPLTWDDTVQCIDLGNAEKVLADALQGVLIVDDKQIWEQTKQRMEPDEEGPRVVIIVSAIARETPQDGLGL